MMSKVEEGDLDIRVSMALVLTGRYRDLMEIRAQVREKIEKNVGARFIHGTISSVPLYIIKQDDWRRLKDLESTGGDKKIG
jgi:hypothetical protein